MYRVLNLYKISHRLWLMAIISILCVITISTIDAHQIRENLYLEKQTKTRHVVEAVYGVLEFFQTKEQRGELNRKAAQTAALEMIKQLRYQDKEYFWLNDMRPRMIMHPYKPELEGKELASIKDPAGKQLFVEFVDLVRQQGGGFVDYLWRKPGKDKPVSKTSYVKGFEPWGWIIGSGVYIDDVDAAYWAHWQNSLISLLLVLGLLATLTTLLSRSITVPIQRMNRVIRKLAMGEADFSEGLYLTGNSEISEMARDFNAFVDKLHGLVNQLMSTSESLLSSTNQVTSIANETNQSVGKQHAESDQVAVDVTELNAAANDVANNAAQAALAAEQANDLALESKQVLVKSTTSISNLHEIIKTTTGVIRQLQTGSEQIGGIVETIQSISEQTNLLALNAAIEAARAGDQGRGFAVVADEVRELAQRTQDSTLEIEKMISQLQQSAEQAVKVVGSGQTEAESTVKHTQQTAESLVKIVDSIANIVAMNTQIATAAQQQSAVVNEIDQNVTRISAIASENSERASTTVGAASNMGTQLNDLMRVATDFRLSQQDASFDFAAARSAHLAWVNRVEAHLDGQGTIGEDELVSHHNCALGKWYDGPGINNYGHIDAMRQIKAPHAQLHSTIGECIRLAKQGDQASAREKLQQLEGLSNQIVELLNLVEREVRKS